MRDFITDFFLPRVAGSIFIATLPNDRDATASIPERHLLTRDPERIARFVSKWDKPERGLFYSVSTIADGKPRRKQHAREMAFVHADIDFKSIEFSRDQVEEVLRNLPIPPARGHASGNGLHCFWPLAVPLTTLEEHEAAAKTMRRLAHALSSDRMVCHSVALLRFPGSHNTKGGNWREVEVAWDNPDQPDTSLEELERMLDAIPQPLIPKRDTGESNPFLRAADEMGFRGPIDVEQRLADMTVGDVDSGVHITLLSCSAALMNDGVPEDEVVERLMAAVRRVAPRSWNLGLEERKIRRLCSDWRRKHPEVADRERRERPSQSEILREEIASSGPDDFVVEGSRPAHLRVASSQPDPDPDPPPRPKVRKRSDVEREDAPKPKKITGAAGMSRDDMDDGTGEAGEGDSSNVVSLAAARDQRRPSKKKGDAHVVIGEGILNKLRDQGQQILYSDSRLWRYRDGIWSSYTGDEEKAWIASEVELGCRALRITSTTKLVNEARSWLLRNPGVYQPRVDWDAHGMIPTRSGMLDPSTLEIVPLAPEHRATRVIPCEYDASAECPVWESMVSDVLASDEMVRFVQEVIGMSLLPTKPRALMRALVLLGPSNSGKSNLLNVMAGLSGDKVNSTALATLENVHGLVSFLQPHPWVLHEAFEQSRWEMSANAKALMSGDPVTVNIKNGALVTHQFRAPIFWGTNVPPQFKESSRAMENRLVIVKCQRVYDPQIVVGAAKIAQDRGYSSPSELVLRTELSGLLNWAVAGMVRARTRGHYVMPEAIHQELYRMRMDSNMASGFLEECVDFDINKMISVPDMYGAFAAWWRENRGGQTPSVDSFGRAMVSLSDPRIVRGKTRTMRWYAGIKMNESGLDYWNAHSQSVFADRSGMRISDAADDVNATVLGQWWDKEEMRMMRAAQAPSPSEHLAEELTVEVDGDGPSLADAAKRPQDEDDKGGGDTPEEVLTAMPDAKPARPKLRRRPAKDEGADPKAKPLRRKKTKPPEKP